MSLGAADDRIEVVVGAFSIGSCSHGVRSMKEPNFDASKSVQPKAPLIVGFSSLLSLVAVLAAADDVRKSRWACVDLHPSCNHLLDDDFGDRFVGNNLARLPRGERSFEGTNFKVGEALIRVRGGDNGALPEKVEGIKVKARADRLHFLHGTEFDVPYDPENEGDPAARTIGAYIVHYAGETTERIPIVYGRDVTDWWAYPDAPLPKKGKTAWKGSNTAAADFAEGITIRLYSLSWANPHPDQEIVAIDFVSKGTKCQPFLVALTLETQEQPNEGDRDSFAKKREEK
jgi:hypothetical protein